MTIGEQIQRIRIQKELTQERLAEMLDVSTDTLLLSNPEDTEEKKTPRI